MWLGRSRTDVTLDLRIHLQVRGLQRDVEVDKPGESAQGDHPYPRLHL